MFQGYQLPPGIFRGQTGSGNTMVNANAAAISAKLAAAGGRATVSASQPPQAAAAPKQKKPAAPKGEKSLPENPQVR